MTESKTSRSVVARQKGMSVSMLAIEQANTIACKIRDNYLDNLRELII